MSNERNRERAGQPERGGLPELVRLATPLDPALGDAEIPDCGPDVARILVRALSMQLRRVERTKILQQLLVEIAEVTGSAFGFVGAVRVNPDNRRELVLLARQGFSIDAHAVSFYGYLEGERLVITNETSLFGSALSRGTVVLRNAPPQAKQVPQASHPIPRTFMALPLYAGDSFVGVVALCNRPQGYDESLVVSIRPAAHVVGLLLSTFRSEDERERLRAELQHGHTRLMSLLAGLPIGMVVHNETRELISANHHFFALFPAIREPPSGRGSFNALALIAGVGRYVGDRLGFKEEVHRFLSQNASVVGVELLLTDGRTILLDFLPIRDANGQLGAVWQFRDVTGDRRFASELMEAKRRAEQSSQTKSRFLATMSHEIRTPLNAILGMADLLLETSLSTEQRNLLRTQRSASETLLNVIQGNLDMAKIEAGRMELDRIPFSLREVVERIIEIHTIRADQKGLELLADIDPRLPPQVLGDPVRTQQIVTNLVSNALKFTDSGGVRVTIRPVDDARPELLEIVVSDSGVGIPEAEQARIFEEFVQAGHRRRADAPGTGLGLPITARLLELMGGSIHCESEVGVGSRFYVRIPFEVVELGPPQRAESSSVFEALILAPTPEARLALSKQMQALGVKSRLALDLADALRGLASRPPSRRQLVLFDVGMLQLSGFRLADLLRACEARILTKVVAITDDDSVISDVLVDPRIHARLNKPIRLEALRQTISGLDEPTALAGGSGLWSMGVAGHDQQPDNTGLRILVVEDHHDNRMLFRTFLVGAGYTVDEVNDGREALRAAIAFRYDLIVMDLQMPNMNGLVATRYIRERERIEGRDPTPIVAVTAHAIEGLEARCGAAGTDGFATKPISKRDFLDLVDRHVDRRPSVLIVDDSPENTLLVERLLAKIDRYRISTASTGALALESVSRQRVDLVLLDLELPDINGFSVAAEVARRCSRRPRVVALTGHTDAATRIRCLSAGFARVLRKPLHAERLVESVEAELRAPRQDGTPPGLASSRPATLDEPSPIEESTIHDREATLEDSLVLFDDPEHFELAQRYLENRRAELALLSAHLASENFAEIRRLGHNMKGTAASYGFTMLSAIGAELERDASERQASDIARLLEELSSFLEWIRVELRSIR